MRISAAIILMFAARYGVAAWFDRRHDADLAWQNWLGLQILHSGRFPTTLGRETFTAHGAHWVPQEWALSIAVALVSAHATFGLLAAVAALCGVIVLALSALASRRFGASALATAVCVACCGFSMVESYGVRAQVLAWPFLASLMFVLRCGRGSRWWIVPITVAWANLHGSALLAPVLVAVWTMGVAFEERAWNRCVRENVLLTVATAAAVCLTPLGTGLPVFAFDLMRSPIRDGIQEWGPTTLASDAFKFGFLPLMLAVAATGITYGRRYSELMLFALATWLALSALRNIPIGAIIIAPIAARSLTRLLRDTARVTRLLNERPVQWMLNAAGVVCALIIAVSLAGTPRFRDVSLPQQAVASAAALRGQHNLFCEDWAWCSLALQYANVRTFVDGRCDAFPRRVWDEQQQIERNRTGWQGMLARHSVDVVLARRNHELASSLISSRSWRERYADSRFVLFVRV